MTKKQFLRYMYCAYNKHKVDGIRTPPDHTLTGVCRWTYIDRERFAYSLRWREGVVEYSLYRPYDVPENTNIRQGWDAVFYWEEKAGLNIVAELNLELIV